MDMVSIRMPSDIDSPTMDMGDMDMVMEGTDMDMVMDLVTDMDIRSMVVTVITVVTVMVTMVKMDTKQRPSSGFSLKYHLKNELSSQMIYVIFSLLYLFVARIDPTLQRTYLSVCLSL